MEAQLKPALVLPELLNLETTQKKTKYLKAMVTLDQNFKWKLNWS